MICRDDDDNDDDDDDGSVMTSHLPVGYRADRRNPGKRKSKEASRKQVSSRYQPFDLVEWGSQRRDSHLANGWSSLKLSLAYDAMHCVTDPRAVRTLLKYTLKTDVEKNPRPASEAQRRARNTRRKRRRAKRKINKINNIAERLGERKQNNRNVECTEGQYTRG